MLKALLLFVVSLSVHATDLRTAKGFELVRDPSDAETFVSPDGKTGITANQHMGRLLPDRFRMVNDKTVQETVDRLTIRLFDAASVRRSLCFLSAFAKSDLTRYLAVSPKAAETIAKRCGPQHLDAFTKNAAELMRSSFLGLDNQKMKRYGIALVRDGYPAIEGFTDKNGATVLMVNENETGDLHLLRLVAHEIAISFDQVAIFPPAYDDSWQNGLRYVFPDHANFTDPADLHELLCALRDPAVHYGATAERAFRFEDQAMRDLGLISQTPALASKERCARTLGVRAVEVANLGYALEMEVDEGLFDSCGISVLRDPQRVQTLVARIQKVANTTLTFADGSGTVPVCDLILDAHVGVRNALSSKQGGPRPRIGGW